MKYKDLAIVCLIVMGVSVSQFGQAMPFTALIRQCWVHLVHDPLDPLPTDPNLPEAARPIEELYSKAYPESLAAADQKHLWLFEAYLQEVTRVMQLRFHSSWKLAEVQRKALLISYLHNFELQERGLVDDESQALVLRRQFLRRFFSSTEMAILKDNVVTRLAFTGRPASDRHGDIQRIHAHLKKQSRLIMEATIAKWSEPKSAPPNQNRRDQILELLQVSNPSPEQVRGLRIALLTDSELYSLGIIRALNSASSFRRFVLIQEGFQPSLVNYVLSEGFL